MAQQKRGSPWHALGTILRSSRGRPNRRRRGDACRRWWQRYAAELHEQLLRRWAGELPAGTLVLKTDLFEEAMGDDHPCQRIVALGWRPLGMDVGKDIARAAWRRGVLAKGLGPVVHDVRQLAFADASLSAILCNSTLDHFAIAGEIDVALSELRRVLAPGGRLLLTLDNPRNPVIALRNALPRRLTDWLGITDFYVGPTLSLREARRRVERLGLRVEAMGTFMHAQRFLALRRLWQAEASGRSGDSEVRRLLRCEQWGHQPTAQLTGHFIYLDVRKPEAGA